MFASSRCGPCETDICQIRKMLLGFFALCSYFDGMRFFAIIAMALAWMAYGTMSAWAGCPTCLSMQTVAATSSVEHHHVAGMDMGETAKSAPAQQDPCSATGMVHMPFCSACLVVPPPMVFAAAGKHVFSYPAPGPADAMRDARPQPLAPPPRLV
ncbi:hypothetical protein [Rhizobium grahamii]|nr:hypothetical protein [Rhizobium grahamii]